MVGARLIKLHKLAYWRTYFRELSVALGGRRPALASYIGSASTTSLQSSSTQPEAFLNNTRTEAFKAQRADPSERLGVGMQQHGMHTKPGWTYAAAYVLHVHCSTVQIKLPSLLSTLRVRFAILQVPASA